MLMIYRPTEIRMLDIEKQDVKRTNMIWLYEKLQDSQDYKKIKMKKLDNRCKCRKLCWMKSFDRDYDVLVMSKECQLTESNKVYYLLN